jgi:hypothetical protein
MDAQSTHERIEQETVQLRAAFPQIRDCHHALVQWSEASEPRYSLYLDIRWPQHQTLLSGPARDSAEAAIGAAFQAARERLHQATWASR